MEAVSSVLVCPELGHIYTLINDELYSHPILKDGTYDPDNYQMVDLWYTWYTDPPNWLVCTKIRDTLRTVKSIEEGSLS